MYWRSQHAVGFLKYMYLTKKLIWESFENSLEKQLQLEKSAIGICGKSADYRNAILSFANKKAPVFYGK